MKIYQYHQKISLKSGIREKKNLSTNAVSKIYLKKKKNVIKKKKYPRKNPEKPWENHRKKTWENPGNTPGKSCANPGKTPLKNVQALSAVLGPEGN